MYCTALIAATMLTHAPLTAGPTASPVPPQPIPMLTEDPIQQPQSQYYYKQPYTPPSAAFESRVQGCGLSGPRNLAAMDDFKVTRTGDLIRIRWWGELLLTAQVGHPYYVAIYTDANCQPANRVYQACVVPQVRMVSNDCVARPVFEFRTGVPPFHIVAGRRYWIQISEADAESVRPGVEDFRWSGRQPVRGCRALQTPDYVNYRPLVDPCNHNPSDLSFDLLINVP